MKRILNNTLILLCVVSLLAGCGSIATTGDNPDAGGAQDTEKTVVGENVAGDATPTGGTVPDNGGTPYISALPGSDERYELERGGEAIGILYSTGAAGQKIDMGINPFFTGKYESVEADIHDLNSVAGLPDKLPVFRLVDPPAQAGAEIDNYDKVIEHLEADARAFLMGTEAEKDESLWLKNPLGGNKHDPKFFISNRDLTFSFNSALTFFSSIIQVEGGEDVTPENVLDVMKGNEYYEAAVKYLEITDPVVVWRVNHMYEDLVDRRFTIYQTSDDPLELMYNIAFKSIGLSTFGDGQFVMTLNKASSVEYIGDSPVISYEAAVEEMTSVYNLPAEDILAWDIGYYHEITPGHYIPCYRFVVRTYGRYYHQTPEPVPEGVYKESIDIIVPAIELGG